MCVIQQEEDKDAKKVLQEVPIWDRDAYVDDGNTRSATEGSFVVVVLRKPGDGIYKYFPFFYKKTNQPVRKLVIFFQRVTFSSKVNEWCLEAGSSPTSGR